MEMNTLKALVPAILVYLLLGIGVCATAVIIAGPKFIDLYFLVVFSPWVLAPYIAVGVYAYIKIKRKKKLTASIIFSGTITIVGVCALVDIVYIHPDAQGGIAILMVPFFQYMAIGLASLILIASSGKKRTEL